MFIQLGNNGTNIKVDDTLLTAEDIFNYYFKN